MYVTIDGVWIGEWIYWLLTPLGTTGIYSAIADHHTLQITTAPAKPFSSLLCLIGYSLAATTNSGDSLASRTQLLFSQPPVQNPNDN
jgi:hypothetical protein